MGCATSKQSEDNAGPARISNPQGGLELIPAPRRDEHGMPVIHQQYDLDRVHLQRALTYAAEYLHEKRANIVITTVGGAVNTLLLKTRQTTHDVDFFVPQDHSSNMRLLEQASRVAEAKASLPLGGDWLNNTTSLYISGSLRQELAQQAVEQNEVVFQAPGLTVLAAPWIYALCAKVGRLASASKRKAYDTDDAVAYLRRYIVQHGNKPIAYRTLREMAAHFKTDFNVDVCREVNIKYEAKFRQPGIQL